MQNFNLHGFRFYDSNYRAGYGVFQFLYKGYEVSASNIGVDKGGCPNQVAIFKGEGSFFCVAELDTVEDAIDWINNNV